MRRLRHTENLPENVASGLHRRGIARDTLRGMWLWPLGPMTSQKVDTVEVSSLLKNPGVLWLVTGTEDFGGNHLVDHRKIPKTVAFPVKIPVGNHEGAIGWMTNMLDTLHPIFLGAGPPRAEKKFKVEFEGRYSDPDSVTIYGAVSSYYLYFSVGGGKFAKIVTSTDGMIITATVNDTELDKGQGIVWEPLGKAEITNRDKAWEF